MERRVRSIVTNCVTMNYSLHSFVAISKLAQDPVQSEASRAPNAARSGVLRSWLSFGSRNLFHVVYDHNLRRLGLPPQPQSELFRKRE